MIKGRNWAAFTLCLALGACTQTGAEVATSLDPTGLSGAALSAAKSTEDSDERGSGFNLNMIAPRLKDIAAGNLADPDVTASASARMTEANIKNSMSLAMNAANQAIGAVATGGASLASGGVALAEQAAGNGLAMARSAEIQARMSSAQAMANAQRSASRAVPDEDRPSEAKALLILLDGSGRSTAWQNPETGASGKVTLGPTHPSPNGLTCRIVMQEWKGEGQVRNGNMALCRQNGDWYVLS